MGHRSAPPPHLTPRTVLFSTEHKPYADVISYGYQMLHSFKGLAPLKTFLLSGTTVTVVEEKVRPPGLGVRVGRQFPEWASRMGSPESSCPGPCPDPP